MAAYRRVYDSRHGVTCRLTAKNRDQLRNPTLGNRVRAIPFLTKTSCYNSANQRPHRIYYLYTELAWIAKNALLSDQTQMNIHMSRTKLKTLSPAWVITSIL